jgi:tRNA(fMet)-specific endonuclease VapC
VSGSVLLDTNIVIAILAKDPAVHQRLAKATEVFVPSIVLGELYYGARKSSHVESNLRTVDQFAAANRVLACDSITAQQYGEIKNLLRDKGRPIPENDIWIAATAKQRNLTLVSRDNHFDEVEGLSIERW